MTVTEETFWLRRDVDERWKYEYLKSCIQAFLDGEIPNDRYEPSDHEWEMWAAAMRERMPELLISPETITWTAAHALAAWAEVWEFDDLIAMANPKPKPDPYDIPF